MTCSVAGEKCGKERSFLCRDHLATLTARVRKLDSLDTELKVTAYGQANFGGPFRDGSRSSEIPLPFRSDAGALAYSLRQCVDHWFRVAAHARFAGRVMGPACVSCTHSSCVLLRVLGTYATADMARWLADQVSFLRFRADVGSMFDDVSSITERVLTLIDRPADRWYAGKCDACTADMYAAPGAGKVICRVCHANYDTESRRAYLISSAQDHLASAGTISAALTSLGDPVTEDRIHLWKSKGQLIPRGFEPPVTSYDSAGRRRTRELALYRVGDVIDLMTAAKQAKLRRSTRRKVSM